MNDNLKLFIWAVMIIVGVILITGWHQGKINEDMNKMGAGYYGTNMLANRMTMASTTIAEASSTTILVNNDERKYAAVCNNSTTTVFLYFTTSTDGVTVDGSASIGEGGYALPTTKCYEIDSTNLYRGYVFGYATNTTAEITTLESN